MPDRHERVMAFDFGVRWIGVAQGQSMLGTGSPVARLKARDGIPRWPEIDALVAEWRPQRLLVGLPLNMDGSESEMSLRARKFSRRLGNRFGGEVSLVDERLTSHEAKQGRLRRGESLDLAGGGVDGDAAVLILEDWFRVYNAKAGRGPGHGQTATT